MVALDRLEAPRLLDDPPAPIDPFGVFAAVQCPLLASDGSCEISSRPVNSTRTRRIPQRVAVGCEYDEARDAAADAQGPAVWSRQTPCGAVRPLHPG